MTTTMRNAMAIASAPWGYSLGASFMLRSPPGTAAPPTPSGLPPSVCLLNNGPPVHLHLTRGEDISPCPPNGRGSGGCRTMLK